MSSFTKMFGTAQAGIQMDPSTESDGDSDTNGTVVPDTDPDSVVNRLIQGRRADYRGGYGDVYKIQGSQLGIPGMPTDAYVLKVPKQCKDGVTAERMARLAYKTLRRALKAKEYLRGGEKHLILPMYVVGECGDGRIVDFRALRECTDCLRGVVLRDGGIDLMRFSRSLRQAYAKGAIRTDEYWAVYQHLVAETLKGLQFIHQSKLVHQDIKAANIVVNDDSGAVRIVDWGSLAKIGQLSRGKRVLGKKKGGLGGNKKAYVERTPEDDYYYEYSGTTRGHYPREVVGRKQDLKIRPTTHTQDLFALGAMLEDGAEWARQQGRDKQYLRPPDPSTFRYRLSREDERLDRQMRDKRLRFVKWIKSASVSEHRSYEVAVKRAPFVTAQRALQHCFLSPRIRTRSTIPEILRRVGASRC